jgi:hypothetical protein
VSLLRRLLDRLLRRPAAPAYRYAPGEIVWGFVRFEDDPGAGKDRPVLVSGYERGKVRVHALSSQAKHGAHRDWFPVGSGPWDREHRPSWVRLRPAYLMPESDVRRRAGHLDPGRLREVVAAIAGQPKAGW